MTFGGVPEDCRLSDETYDLDLVTTHDTWWTARLRGLSYGDDEIKESGVRYAIIDTGTSFMAIAKTDYYNFARQIMKIKGMRCSYINGCYSTEGKQGKRCSDYTSAMEPLSIQLDFTVFTIPASEYTFDRYNYTGKHFFCQVAINALSDRAGMYILGDPFLRTFPTTFDYANNKMELGISVHAPHAQIHTVMTNWGKFFLTAAIIILVVLILAALYKLCYDSEQNEWGFISPFQSTSSETSYYTEP